jgi:hypothetical protein
VSTEPGESSGRIVGIVDAALPLALQTDAPAPVWLIPPCAGVAFLVYRRDLARLMANHPLLPSAFARVIYPAALGLICFFGVAFVVVGILGFITALVG